MLNQPRAGLRNLALLVGTIMPQSTALANWSPAHPKIGEGCPELTKEELR